MEKSKDLKDSQIIEHEGKKYKVIYESFYPKTPEQNYNDQITLLEYAKKGYLTAIKDGCGGVLSISNARSGFTVEFFRYVVLEEVKTKTVKMHYFIAKRGDRYYSRGFEYENEFVLQEQYIRSHGYEFNGYEIISTFTKEIEIEI